MVAKEVDQPDVAYLESREGPHSVAVVLRKQGFI